MPVCFRDTSGNLITGWTGAASLVSVDAAAGIAGNAPVEIGSTGMGYLDLSAAQMNGQLIEVKCTVTNLNFTAFVAGIYTDPPYVNGVRPTTPLGWLRWLFYYFFAGGSIPRSSGLQIVLDDNGNTLTTIQTTPSDTLFNKFKSSP